MKRIPDFENYAITTDGRIWSLATHQFLSTRPDKDGYLRVNLSKDGKAYTRFVHRLVAITYLPNPDNLPLVNHKDENKKNNNVENLEWCTQWYNITYSRNKDLALAKGVDFKVEEKNKKRTGTSKPVRCIETGEVFASGAEAARQMNLDASHLSKVCRGKLKSTKGYHFEFVEGDEENERA